MHVNDSMLHIYKFPLLGNNSMRMRNFHNALCRLGSSL